MAGRLGPGRAAVAGADQRPDRGVRLRPPGAGRAPRRRRGDHPERRARRRVRRGPVAARVHPRRRRADDRLPRPVRRAAQGPAGAARGDAHRRPPASRGPAADRRPRRRRRGPRADRRRPARRTSGLLGELSEADKAAFLRSVDIYCAPNLLGESFGVVLIEALAAGAPIVASDLDAFARVLEDGDAGVLVRRGDAGRARPRPCAGCWPTPARLAELSAARRAGRGRLRLGRPGPADPRRLRDRPPAGGGEVHRGGRRRAPGRARRREPRGALAPDGGRAATSLTPRDARGLAAAGRRAGPPAARLDGLDPRPAAAGSRPASPAPGRRWTPSCSGGPAWPRSWPASYPAAVGADRGRPYLAAFAADARAPGRRRPGAGREPARPGAARAARRPRRRPGRAADRPRRHRHPGRAGPPLLQRRRPRHPRRCGSRRLPRLLRLHALPAAAALLRHRRPAATGSPGRRRRRTDAAADRPYDGRLADLPSIQRQHPVVTHRQHPAHRHRPRQARHGRAAQGRRHHGRRHPGAGQDRRGRRRRRRHGARAGARRHPRRRAASRG